MEALFVLLMAVILVAVGAQSGEQASCNIDISMDERRNLLGSTILNKFGLGQAPSIVPNPANPDQESNLIAVQKLQSLKVNDDERVSCTEKDAFATENQASFVTKAKEISPYESFDNDYTVYNPYGYLIGTKREKRVSKSSRRKLPSTTYQFTFPIDVSSTDGNRYISSKLYLLHKVSSPLGRNFLTNFETIRLSYVYKNIQYLRKKNRLISVTEKEIITTKVVEAIDGYISFDTTDAVNKWTEHNKAKSGEITFEIAIQAPVLLLTGLPLSPVLEFNVSDNRTAQHVLNFVRPENAPDSSRATRKKRQLKTIPRLDTTFCFANPKEPNCCVRKLSIDFIKDLDYKWILAPKTFQPNYCTGLCPALWPSASNSTGFLRLYKERNPTFAVNPCCSPEEFEPLTVLADVGNGLQLTEIPDMIVKSCICR